MAKLKILGTSSAVPHEDHLNTHFILEGENNTVLIDCIGNQTIRLERAGIVLDDHVPRLFPKPDSGVPELEEQVVADRYSSGGVDVQAAQ